MAGGNLQVAPDMKFESLPIFHSLKPSTLQLKGASSNPIFPSIPSAWKSNIEQEIL